MNREQFKKIFKLAVVIYIASFLIINWSDVSWVFNYRVVYGMVEDFFNPYPGVDASSVKGYFYPNHSAGATANQIKGVKAEYTAKNNTLEMPKLGIEAPIVFPENNAESVIMKNLNLGAVYYPGSVYPGQEGQIVILGHSAPSGWPKIKYDWIFTDLEKMSFGDSVMVNLNNKQYTYKVRNKIIVEKGEDVSTGVSKSDNNILILVSCWPPGKDYQRIAVIAELY